MAKKKDLMEEVRNNAKYAEEYWKDNRDAALDNLEFLFAEDQWDQAIKNERGSRPCLNANDLPTF